jgi:hypothetical protein
MTFHQQPQFGKCLVWREIRVNDHSRCGLRFCYNSVTRQNTHSANERIHVHKGRNLGFVVHKRIGVQFRGFFNELLVKLLSSRPLLRQPSRAILAALREPRLPGMGGCGDRAANIATSNTNDVRRDQSEPEPITDIPAQVALSEPDWKLPGSHGLGGGTTGIELVTPYGYWLPEPPLKISAIFSCSTTHP